jgi:hypothetical protein
MRGGSRDGMQGVGMMDGADLDQDSLRVIIVD